MKLDHLWALGTALIALAGVGCDASTASAVSAESEVRSPGDVALNEGDSEEELVPVEVAVLERGRIEALLRFSTHLEAEEEVTVFSQAPRQVVKLLVEEGDRVRAGQVLLRLQDEEQRSQLARVESELRQERREHDRQQRLYEQKLISEQAMNDMVYKLEQLELQLADSQRELGYTVVKAPISGTVTQRWVSRGDTVTVNQRLFDLTDFDSLVARIYVPERELPRLREGQEVRIISSSLGGEVRHGAVERIAPTVDSKSGTVKVTVDLPPDQGLLPGMYVEAELVTAVHEDALLIPKQALLYDDNQAYLFRLGEAMRVEQIRVEPRLEDSDHVEPRAESLFAAGDRVVVAGLAGLKDGLRVRLTGRADDDR